MNKKDGYKKIGQILMEENVITEQDLNKALDYQKSNNNLKLGEILIMWGIINEEILFDCLEEQHKKVI